MKWNLAFDQSIKILCTFLCYYAEQGGSDFRFLNEILWSNIQIKAHSWAVISCGHCLLRCTMWLWLLSLWMKSLRATMQIKATAEQYYLACWHIIFCSNAGFQGFRGNSCYFSQELGLFFNTLEFVLPLLLWSEKYFISPGKLGYATLFKTLNPRISKVFMFVCTLLRRQVP